MEGSLLKTSWRTHDWKKCHVTYFTYNREKLIQELITSYAWCIAGTWESVCSPYLTVSVPTKESGWDEVCRWWLSTLKCLIWGVVIEFLNPKYPSFPSILTRVKNTGVCSPNPCLVPAGSGITRRHSKHARNVARGNHTSRTSHSLGWFPLQASYWSTL